jgi:hypothetical protein
MIQQIDSPKLFQARTVLTHDLITTLPTTPQPVVPAPGENKVIIVLQALVRSVIPVAYDAPNDSSYITLAFPNDTEIGAYILDDAGASVSGLSQLLVNAASANEDTCIKIIPINMRFITGWGDTSFNYGGLDDTKNKPLNLYCDNGGDDFTSGDNANKLYITVVYMIYDLVLGQFIV